MYKLQTWIERIWPIAPANSQINEYFTLLGRCAAWDLWSTSFIGAPRITLTKYFRDCRLLSVLQKWSQKYDKLFASFANFSQWLHLNNLTYGRKSIAQDCIRVSQIFVSVTRKNWSQKYLVSVSRVSLFQDG